MIKTASTYLNIRVGKPDTSAPIFNFLQPGDTIEVVETLAGKTIEGNNIWYRGKDGNFYWSGGFRPEIAASSFLLSREAFPEQIVFDPAKMSWAFESGDGLGLIDLWNQHNLYGLNMRIAIIDTGINTTINDLMDAVRDKESDLRSFLPANDIHDDVGHGTNCASIASARGYRMFGISPRSDLIVAKVRNKTTSMSKEVLLAALKWACEERKADVISLSFNSTKNEKEVEDYISFCHQQLQKIFVASVGNIGSLGENIPSYPANYKGCLCIGAYGPGRIRWTDSAWNQHLSFLAPGVDLMGYQLSGTTDILQPATSYACPAAAGAIANLAGWYKQKNIPFNAGEFLNKLVFDPGAETAPLQYGKGILNPLKSFQNLIT